MSVLPAAESIAAGLRLHPRDSVVTSLLYWHNAERIALGLNKVVLSNRLMIAAYGHVKWMVEHGSMSHTQRNGEVVGFVDRLNAVGYGFSYAGENIAANFMTPKAVHDAWMLSPGHRSNIMNENHTNIGIGYYATANGSRWWCVVFGRPVRSVSSLDTRNESGFIVYVSEPEGLGTC